MAEEIDISEEEDAALEAAWERLGAEKKCQCEPGQPCTCEAKSVSESCRPEWFNRWLLEDCGTGAGGFKSGNECQSKGGGGGGSEKKPQKAGDLDLSELDTDKGVSEIKDAIAKEAARRFQEDPEPYGRYGIRVVTSVEDNYSPEELKKRFGKKATKPVSYSVGDVLPPSYKWSDGDTSNKKLKGTSTIEIKDIHSEDSIRNAIKAAKIYKGQQIVIVGGGNAGQGQDDNERLLSNAKVLLTFTPKGQG